LPSNKDSYSFCDEDFYYTDAQMLEVARQAGFEAQQMTDWEYLQRKIRATKV
jgi:hypothetical protein